MLHAHVDAFDHNAALFCKHACDNTLLTLIFAGDDCDLVTGVNFHSTSGAWEIIF